MFRASRENRGVSFSGIAETATRKPFGGSNARGGVFSKRARLATRAKTETGFGCFNSSPPVPSLKW